MKFRDLIESKTFKIGDNVKLLPFIKGKTQPKTREGKVISINDTKEYPIKVRFSDGSFGTYQVNGSIEPDSQQVLFLDN